jgi:hypothetical protein
MKIFMPINPAKGIYTKVTDTWLAQTEPSEIIACGVATKGNIDREAEALSRKNCSGLACVSGDKYVCMADPDCWPVERTNISEARTRLDDNGKLGAVAFSREPINNKTKEHVDIKAFVIRTGLLEKIDWFYRFGKACLCYNVMYFLEQNGYIIEYLDTRKRIDCF